MRVVRETGSAAARLQPSLLRRGGEVGYLPHVSVVQTIGSLVVALTVGAWVLRVVRGRERFLDARGRLRVGYAAAAAVTATVAAVVAVNAIVAMAA